VVIFLNCKKSFWLIYDGYGKDVIDKPNLSMTAPSSHHRYGARVVLARA
jgi:hypothetical protein